MCIEYFYFSGIADQGFGRVPLEMASSSSYFVHKEKQRLKELSVAGTVKF